MVPLLKKQHHGLKVAIETNPFVTHYEAGFLIQAVNTLFEIKIRNHPDLNRKNQYQHK